MSTHSAKEIRRQLWKGGKRRLDIMKVFVNQRPLGERMKIAFKIVCGKW